MNWTISQTVDLAQGYTPVVWPNALMVSGDVGAHTWRLTVLDNGVPADLSGATITGRFLRADGNTVTVAGTVSGNIASVTLTDVCYAVEGKMKGTIKMTKSGAVITLAAVIFTVSLFTSGSVIDPGVAYADFQIDASPAGTYADLAALISDDPDHSKIYITLDDGKWCYHNGTTWVAGGVYQAALNTTMGLAVIVPHSAETLVKFDTATGTLTFPPRFNVFTNTDRYYFSDSAPLSPGAVNFSDLYPDKYAITYVYNPSLQTFAFLLGTDYPVPAGLIPIAFVHRRASYPNTWYININTEVLPNDPWKTMGMPVIVPTSTVDAPEFDPETGTLTFRGRFNMLTAYGGYFIDTEYVPEPFVPASGNASMVIYYDTVEREFGTNTLSAYTWKYGRLVVAVSSLSKNAWILNINGPYEKSSGSVDANAMTYGKISGQIPLSDLPGVGDVGSPFDYTTDTHTTVYDAFDALVTTNPEYITREKLGETDLETPIYQYTFAPKRLSATPTRIPKVLIGSTMHGDEGIAAITLYNFCKRLCEEWLTVEPFEYIRTRVELSVIPLVSPDGYDAKSHFNSNDVNINQNFETRWEDANIDTKGVEPFSEAETQAIRDWFIANDDADLFIDVHARAARQNVPDDDIADVRMTWGTKSIGHTVVEQMTAIWHKQFPALQSTAILGEVAYWAPSAGTVRAYANETLGIRSITFEGFSKTPTFSTPENADVVNMNTDFFGRLMLVSLKHLTE